MAHEGIAPPILVKVGVDGRISIPKPYRDLIGLREGDYVLIEILGIKRGKRGDEK